MDYRQGGFLSSNRLPIETIALALPLIQRLLSGLVKQIFVCVLSICKCFVSEI